MSSHFGGLWRHADFRRLWLGTTISQFGSMIGNGAVLYTAILWLHAGAWEMAVLTGCTIIPGFAFVLLGGALVDRVHRRPVLIFCDLGRFAVLASIPLAAVFDVLTIVQVWAVAFLATALTDALFNPAYEAYLPTVISREKLAEGNSKLTASASVAEFSGFSLSGWLVQLLRGPGAIALDAMTFLASAFAIWRIKTPEPAARAKHEREHLLQEIRAGTLYVARSPVLRSLAAADIFLAMGGRMLSVVFLLYLNQEVGFSPGVLGMIFAVGGITSLLSSLVATRLTNRFHFGRLVFVALLLVPLGAITMPLATSVSVLGVAYLVWGQIVVDPGQTFWDISKVTTRQSITPDAIQGRMNSTMRVLEFSGAAAGAAIGGVLGTAFGPRETLFVAASVMAMPAVMILISPLMRMPTAPVYIEAV